MASEHELKLESVPAAFATAAAISMATILCLLIVRRRRRLQQLRERVAHACSRVAAGCSIKSCAIIVNPNSGGGDGLFIYNEVVLPMLEAANLREHAIVHFTKSGGDAARICHDLASANGAGVDVIISVSGDGALHECLNGLIGGAASLRKTACSFPLAICPAGSGNGVAASLYGRGGDAVDAIQAILLSPRSKPRAVDVMRVRYLDDDSGSGTVSGSGMEQSQRRYELYDLHYACWAVFSDHDFLTEGPLRWMGPALKSLMAPLIVIGRLQTYHGTCDFEPVPASHPSYSDPTGLPVTPEDATLRRIEGSFWTWAIANMSEGGGDTTPAPHASVDEGAADLLVCMRSPRLSRWRVAQLFIAMESGRHIDAADDVQIYKVKRVRLYPTAGAGHLQLSGQEMPKCAPVEIDVMRGIAVMRY